MDIILRIVIVTLLFVNLSPEFGGKATQEQKDSYRTSKNYKADKFVNTNAVQLDMSLSDMGKALAGYFRPQPKSTPDKSLPVIKIDRI